MAGTRSALIVASDDYTDPGLRRLRAPASDARALEAVLRDPAIGGFDVRTLLNAPVYEVNVAVEEFFADRRPDDLLLLHFSCHGVKDEAGELYFATSNTVLRRLAATAVAAEFVNRRMNRSRSRRVVLLLDCCYAGAFERGMSPRAGSEVGIEAQFGGRGRAVITASSAMEYAFEGDQLADAQVQAQQPSVFTNALVEGLATGEADRDQDGMVGLDELYDYVYDQVRAATPNQTPSKWTFGVQGDLYIARRARPVTTPAPLPAELQEAIASPLATVRAAAVQELARLLQSRHAGLALAARLTLDRLVGDDSRMVTAAATAALDVLAPPGEPPPGGPPPTLALSAAAVEFGRLPQHGRSPERRVRLGNSGGGILNAHASTTASWLELRQVGDELVLAVDTTAAGEHEGTVTVDSDGGSATIRVRADVELAPTPEPAPPTTTPLAAGPAGTELEPTRLEPTPHGAPQDAASVPSRPTPAPMAEVAATQPAAPGLPAPVDQRLQAAGQLAILGAALLVVGLFPAYQWGAPLAGNVPWRLWYAVLVAAIAAGAGVCVLMPRTRQVIGPGLLLGIAAASSWGLAALGSDWVYHNKTGFEGGFWVEVVAHLILILAACLAGLSLARAGAVRRARRPPAPERALAGLIVLVGAVGALVLVLHAGRLVDAGWDTKYVAPLIAGTIPALGLPLWAAAVVPRQFGASLLIGWAGGGIAGAIENGWFLRTNYPDIGTELTVIFGVTLLVLGVAAVVLARAAPSVQVEHATQG